MKIPSLFILVMLVLVFPLSAGAQCHHFSGHTHVSHSHVGHSSHVHFHSSHTCHSHYRRSRSYSHSYRTTSDSDPMKNVTELSTNVGYGSGVQVMDNTLNSAGPVFNGSFKYFITNGVAVGISVASQSLGGRDTCNCLTGSTPFYNYKSNALTVTAGITWIYYKSRFFESYGGAEAGVTMYRETDKYGDNTTSSATGYKFAGQLTLGGFRVGGAFGANLEFGYGYKGIVSAGISYQVGNRNNR